MEETLRQLVAAIIKIPEEVSLTSEEEAGRVVITIHIQNDENKGIVIGKNGKTIKALSDIIGVKALKQNKKVSLKVA